ncbi:unnamed protein product, partial [Rotaria magnacalcarata]
MDEANPKAMITTLTVSSGAMQPRR